jgi:hypothetical protein
MSAKSLKRALGLAAAAVSTSGTMMLAPGVVNAATARPAHTQTVSTASTASTASNFAKARNGSRRCRTVRVRTVVRTVRGPRVVYRYRTVCR